MSWRTTIISLPYHPVQKEKGKKLIAEVVAKNQNEADEKLKSKGIHVE